MFARSWLALMSQSRERRHFFSRFNSEVHFGAVKVFIAKENHMELGMIGVG
jgi:hypothetical protein